MTLDLILRACIPLVIFGYSVASPDLQNHGPQPEKCVVKSREPNAPDYLVGQVRHTGDDKPSEIYVLISIEPKQFKKEQMIALARQLKKDFCKEIRFGVIIFDDYMAARYVTYLSITKDLEKAQRGFYHIDRKKRSEYIQFSTARGKPLDEVRINLLKD